MAWQGASTLLYNRIFALNASATMYSKVGKAGCRKAGESGKAGKVGKAVADG